MKEHHAYIITICVVAMMVIQAVVAVKITAAADEVRNLAITAALFAR